MIRNGDRCTMLFPMQITPEAGVLLHLTFDARGRLVDFTINPEKHPSPAQRKANDLVLRMRDRCRAGERLPQMLDEARETGLLFRCSLVLDLLCLENLNGKTARELLAAGPQAGGAKAA
jgi:hypothetical protein